MADSFESWAAVERAFARFMLSRGRAVSTALAYVYNVRFFWNQLTADGIDPITADEDVVAGWLTLRRARVSANKNHVDLMALRAFYNCAVYRGWRTDNPTEGLRVNREELAPEAPYTEAEVRALLLACSTERDQLIYLLLFSTGIRISELIGIHKRDIDFGNGAILIHGKGSYQRWVTPEPFILERLEAFAEKYNDLIWLTKYQTPLTPKTCRANLDAVALRAGVRNAHPHRFRTTFAIAMLKNLGGDIHAVQGMMGHKSIMTTDRYTRWGKAARSLELMRTHNPAAALLHHREEE